MVTRAILTANTAILGCGRFGLADEKSLEKEPWKQIAYQIYFKENI